MAYAGEGNLIGEEDIVQSPTYRTTVQCLSQEAELIMIKKEDFDRLKSNNTTWTNILKLAELKQDKY